MMAGVALIGTLSRSSVHNPRAGDDGEEAACGARTDERTRHTGPNPAKPAAPTGNAVIGTLRCRVCGEQTTAPCEAWTTPTTVIR